MDKKLDKEAVAIEALNWIASDEKMLNRFLAISGLSVENLRDAAKEPGFLAGVLAFLTGHEPTLMAFCNANDVDPQLVADAWRAMGGDTPYESSI